MHINWFKVNTLVLYVPTCYSMKSCILDRDRVLYVSPWEIAVTPKNLCHICQELERSRCKIEKGRQTYLSNASYVRTNEFQFVTTLLNRFGGPFVPRYCMFLEPRLYVHETKTPNGSFFGVYVCSLSVWAKHKGREGGFPIHPLPSFPWDHTCTKTYESSCLPLPHNVRMSTEKYVLRDKKG